MKLNENGKASNNCGARNGRQVGGMEYFMYRIRKEFGKSSSFQIIMVAILLHSLVSVLLIYVHLVYYNDSSAK